MIKNQTLEKGFVLLLPLPGYQWAAEGGWRANFMRLLYEEMNSAKGKNEIIQMLLQTSLLLP